MFLKEALWLPVRVNNIYMLEKKKGKLHNKKNELIKWLLGAFYVIKLNIYLLNKIYCNPAARLLGSKCIFTIFIKGRKLFILEMSDLGFIIVTGIFFIYYEYFSCSL